MNPIKFKEQNFTYTKPESMTDEECSSLPVYKQNNEIISCWKMSFKERIKALFTGKVWFCVMSYSQPPIWLDVNSPFVSKSNTHEV